MMNKIAQSVDLFPSGGKLEGKGPLGLESPALASDAFLVFPNLISSIVGVLTVVASIWFLFILVSGGLAIMSAGGDKAKIAQARSRITSGAIGLLVTIAAIFIFQLFGSLIGVDISRLWLVIVNLQP